MPVYFEPRLIKVGLAADVTEEDLDQAADEATLGLDDTERARIEAVRRRHQRRVRRARSGSTALAADLVAHWENRRARMGQFIEAPGKAMIVGGTREICAQLYAAIVELRPDWHADDRRQGQDQGRLLRVPRPTCRRSPTTCAATPLKQGRSRSGSRTRTTSCELVIVKDMMLTGFDAPPLHTLYLDRPLKGALLMQTLARVNRTFRGKEDGLLVAYAPLAENLAKALAEYTAVRPDEQAGRPEHRRGRCG